VAKIYYLNWDEENRTIDDPELGPASELFHNISVKEVLDKEDQPVEEYSRDEFEDLYREVSEVDVDDPEMAWRQWNRGSGYESREFLYEEVRSMSVGDVVEVNGEYYRAETMGWEQILVQDGGSEM